MLPHIYNETYGISDLLFKQKTLDGGGFSYKEEMSLALKCKFEEAYSVLASAPTLGRLVLDVHEGACIDGTCFISLSSSNKPCYSSVRIKIFGTTPSAVEQARLCIKELLAEFIISEKLFSVSWVFVSGGMLHETDIEEISNDVIVDEAYPSIIKGVKNFCQDYIKSSESILVLQGPPGTGKTRLIRNVLGELSQTVSSGSVLYTGDTAALEQDELFVRFLTGNYYAMVVEDADHLLKPRADGNTNLHRFLTAADGVVRANGRKIIFSTNLPNLGDLDDALIRPGRCFARLNLGLLNKDQSAKFLAAKGREDLIHKLANNNSLAELYKLL